MAYSNHLNGTFRKNMKRSQAGVRLLMHPTRDTLFASDIMTKLSAHIPQAPSMDVCLLAYMLRTRLQIVFATNVDSYKEDARLRHCLRAVSCIMN